MLVTLALLCSAVPIFFLFLFFLFKRACWFFSRFQSRAFLLSHTTVAKSQATVDGSPELTILVRLTISRLCLSIIITIITTFPFRPPHLHRLPSRLLLCGPTYRTRLTITYLHHPTSVSVRGSTQASSLHSPFARIDPLPLLLRSHFASSIQTLCSVLAVLHSFDLRTSTRFNLKDSCQPQHPANFRERAVTTPHL